MHIALIAKSTLEILGSWRLPEGETEVRTRFRFAPDNSISPIILGWEDALYAVVELVPFVAPEGRVRTGDPSYEMVDGRLVETYAMEDAPPPPRRLIRKSIVQQRLIDAGLMDAAYAALTSNSAYFARWFAPDRPDVYADDPDALALLAAIGADAEEIMADGE